MRELIAVVHVKDQDGFPTVFEPGDKVPDWAAEQITNPKAWAGTASTSKASASADGLIKGMDTARDKALPIPARGGPKATVEAWTAYANQEIAKRGLHMEIDSDATRKDIIDALAEAGIPT